MRGGLKSGDRDMSGGGGSIESWRYTCPAQQERSNYKQEAMTMF